MLSSGLVYLRLLLFTYQSEPYERIKCALTIAELAVEREGRRDMYHESRQEAPYYKSQPEIPSRSAAVNGYDRKSPLLQNAM